ncbi:MAG TPA: hypothetical protein VI703_10145, partial [Anaerolineales bacterium]|nr:hypothetical protein [Anaerolineales bacterium]
TCDGRLSNKRLDLLTAILMSWKRANVLPSQPDGEIVTLILTYLSMPGMEWSIWKVGFERQRHLKPMVKNLVREWVFGNY